MGAKLDTGSNLVAAGCSMQGLLHLGGTCIKHMGQGLSGEQQECDLESGIKVLPEFRNLQHYCAVRAQALLEQLS